MTENQKNQVTQNIFPGKNRLLQSSQRMITGCGEMESAVKWIAVCHLAFITQHQRPAFGQLCTLSSHITPLARCFSKAHGLWPHHFGLRFHHILQTVKGLDSTWMRSGVSLDWIQAWFNKVLQNFFLHPFSSYFFTFLVFVLCAAFFLLQIQIASVFLNSSHPNHMPKSSFPQSFQCFPFLLHLYFFKTNMNWLQAK